jgi:hypothetical protein
MSVDMVKSPERGPDATDCALDAIITPFVKSVEKFAIMTAEVILMQSNIIFGEIRY